jgi:hypothetical protein
VAIEGPLQELGIHDVFQLLDLSRKTGTLAVVSELRDNEGTVLFENGKIVSANIRSNPHRLGDLLVRSGRLTEADMARAQGEQQHRGGGRRLGEILVALELVTHKEIERQVRLQIEAVVFELMSWREGHFRFEEGLSDLHWRDATVAFPTESLLMEGARRIDEWSRIADRVPNLDMVPYLAPPDEDHPPLLDLLPSEWQVLALIDGDNDLRGISTTLAMSEFDVARITYGMVSTGVIRLRQPERTSRATPLATPGARVDERHETPVDGTVEPLRRGAAAFRRGEFTEGITIWSQFLRSVPQYPGIAAIRQAIAAATTLRDVLAREVPDVQ